MAQFDVYQTARGKFVVDCQADLLSHMSTRVVVPLVDPDSGLRMVSRLNPQFRVEGHELIFFTQYMTSMPLSDLGRRVCSLSNEHYPIMAALDMLITGF